MIKVSVIVPVYNVENYLEECLYSLSNQTLRDVEIICIDDGSTDGSFDILRRHQGRDSRVRVYHQENQGQSAARNRGIERARGKYLYFCDSDDYLQENALEELFRIAEDKGLDILRFSAKGIEMQNEKQEDVYHYNSFERVITGKEALQMYREESTVCWLLLLRREFIEQHKVRFIEGIKREDHAFFIEIYVIAKRVYQISQAFYCHRIRNDSTMGIIQPAKSVEFFCRTVIYLTKKERENGVVFTSNECFYKVLDLLIESHMRCSAEDRKRVQKIESELKRISKENNFYSYYPLKKWITGGEIYCWIWKLKRKGLKWT